MSAKYDNVEEETYYSTNGGDEDVVGHVTGDYTANGYEDALNTRQLAVHCIFCHRPLNDADSVQRGCGPDCADKFGFYNEPGSVDREMVQSGIDQAPAGMHDELQHIFQSGDIKALVQRSIWHAAIASFYKGNDAPKVMAALHSIAKGAGYDIVAARILQMEIKPWKISHEPGAPGYLAIRVPKNETFRLAIRNVPGRRFEMKPEPRWIIPANKLQEAINALAEAWPGQAMTGPEGNAFVIPDRPVVIVPPPTKPAPPPHEATGEQPPPPPPFMKDLEIGEWVLDPEGNKRQVKWLGAYHGEKRVGLAVPGQRGYLFLGYGEVKPLAPQAAAVQAQKSWREQAAYARQMGAVVPPMPDLSTLRQVPASMFPYQIDGVRWLDAVGSGILGDDQGLGKAQPLDAKILTPTGWKLMGEMQVGDDVIDPDGGVAKVTGVFPQGEKDIVRVSLSDGSTTECCTEHLWLVMTPNEPDRVLSTREMLPWAPTYRVPRFAPLTQSLFACKIDSIDPVGRKQAQCIRVSSKRNLYVTDNYIVTHNTLQACVAADAPILVVCKAKLRVNWTREVNMWRPDLKVAMIMGTKAIDPELLNADVVVINYDIIAQHEEQISRRKWRTLIVDESHYIKNVELWNRKGSDGTWELKITGTKWAAAIVRIARDCCERKFLLSGTPMPARPKELFPQLYVVDPRAWNSYMKFCERYCDAHKKPVGYGKTVWDFSGSSNLAELHARIDGVYMLRRTKEMVLPDLPEKSRQSKTVVLSEPYATNYKKACDDFIEWVRQNGGAEAVAKAMRGQRLAKMTALRHMAAIGKLEAAVEWIMEHHESTGRPLIVWAHHRDVVEGVVAKCREAGLRVGLVYGGYSGAQADIDAFQKEARLDVLVCSIQAAKEGLTLTIASEALFVERDWTPSNLVQAEDREHRIGQKNAVTVTYLDAAGTIDAALGRMLMNKIKTVAGVIDGLNLSEEEAADRVFGELFTKSKMTPYMSNPGDQQELFPAFNWVDPGMFA